MTPSDESALARIAAFGLSQGEGQAEIESRLLSYASILTEEQVQTAMERGQGILDVAADIAAGRWERAQLGMADIAIPGLTGWTVYGKYQLAGDEATSWRSIAARVGAGATPADIARELNAAILAQNQEGTDQGRAVVPGSTVYVWVAPSL